MIPWRRRRDGQGQLVLESTVVQAPSALAFALTAASNTTVYMTDTQFSVVGSLQPALISVAVGAFLGSLCPAPGYLVYGY
jgi:hypothetical protein